MSRSAVASAHRSVFAKQAPEPPCGTALVRTHLDAPADAYIRHEFGKQGNAKIQALYRAWRRQTVTRHLAEDGTSLHHILDEVRCDFARALLQDRSLNIGDIAFFLQYSEPAAFHRSFRR